jgi:DNA-binding MarR family transcriptional regulator
MQVNLDGLTTPETPEDAVMLAMMQVGRRIKMRHRDDEIDAAAIPLLFTLQCSGPVRLSDLAGRTRLDASTVSRQARQLEERGFLTRSEDPDDRRASRVTLSADGERALAEAMERRRNRIRDLLSTWDDADRENLKALLTHLVRDLAMANELEKV